MGNVTAYTDPKGNKNNDNVTTSYRYDALNRLMSVKDALNQTTSYTYDGNGQITRVSIQANGGAEQILNTKTYNELGQLTVKKDGAGLSETLEYNNLGQLSKRTDRNGTGYEYTYDEQQQLVSSKLKGTLNGVTQTQEIRSVFAGDGINSRITKQLINDVQTASQKLTVDSLGRTRSTYASAGNHSLSISNSLDSLDRVTQIGDVYVGFYTNYRYAKTRLSQVQTNGSSTRSEAANANVQYAYYANGQVQSLTYPTLTNGQVLSTAYTYNKALGWVESVSNKKGSSVISQYNYTYDNNGNITAVSETVSAEAGGTGTKTTSYGYDALNRLISISRPDGGSTSYTYDVWGNRQTLSDTQPASVSLVDTSYTYDLQNTLKSVTSGGNTLSFTYYADGLRYLKSTSSTGTQVNYNFSGQVITEEKLNGSAVVAQSTYVRGDRLLVKKDKTNNKDYYYLYNGHGDVVQIVDTSGTVKNFYNYDVWGNITSQREDIPNSFKYAGETYDAETGLYYLRARYYDPSIGRFINEDTVEGQIDNPLSQNLYTYVVNNPLIYVDPTGHDNMALGGSGADPLYNLSNTSATNQVISARSADAATQAKILKSLMKEYKYGFFGDNSGGMTQNQFEYLYKLALADGSSNYATAKWAISQLDNYFYYGANDKTISIATMVGVMGAGAISGGGGFNRNLKVTVELTSASFGNLTNNGVIKVNASGSNRPLTGSPNSYYSTVNGEHVFVYDNNGKLIYDLSSQRVKSFRINVSPDGVEHYQPYKLDGPVPDFIKNLFGW